MAAAAGFQERRDLMGFDCAICKGPCEYDVPRPPRPEPLTATQRMRLIQRRRSWWDRYLQLYKRLRVR